MARRRDAKRNRGSGTWRSRAGPHHPRDVEARHPNTAMRGGRGTDWDLSGRIQGSLSRGRGMGKGKEMCASSSQEAGYKRQTQVSEGL